MSRYKKIMLTNGIMQKELLEVINKTNKNVDNSLLTKIINDICLPKPNVLNSLCEYIKCDVLDIYDIEEISLLPNNGNKKRPSVRDCQNGLSHGTNIYNLTVEINRDVAERVFNKTSLRKLGYSTKSDCIRHLVNALDKKLSKINKKSNQDK